jgi:hypothetical protein
MKMTELEIRQLLKEIRRRERLLKEDADDESNSHDMKEFRGLWKWTNRQGDSW